jgi:hypothetical protein
MKLERYRRTEAIHSSLSLQRSPLYWPLGSCDSGGVGRATYIEKWQNAQKRDDTGHLPVAVLRYSHGYRGRLYQRDKVPIRAHASELPRCLVEDGAATLEGREQGESLDTRSTSIQLSEARDELQLLMRGIEGIHKLCEELESDDS